MSQVMTSHVAMLANEDAFDRSCPLRLRLAFGGRGFLQQNFAEMHCIGLKVKKFRWCKAFHLTGPGCDVATSILHKSSVVLTVVYICCQPVIL